MGCLPFCLHNLLLGFEKVHNLWVRELIVNHGWRKFTSFQENGKTIFGCYWVSVPSSWEKFEIDNGCMLTNAVSAKGS